MIFDKFRKTKKSVERIFADIYKKGHWKSTESKSGKGSELKITQILRRELPVLLRDLNVRTMLDVPCGDFNWLKEVDLSFLDKYIGADIVSGLIESNRKLYENNFSNIEFRKIDVIVDPLPESDVILCRDLLIHFSFQDIDKTLEYFHKGLKINEEIGDRHGVAYSLKNLGSMYLEAGDVARAKEYAERSMELARSLGFPDVMSTTVDAVPLGSCPSV